MTLEQHLGNDPVGEDRVGARRGLGLQSNMQHVRPITQKRELRAVAIAVVALRVVRANRLPVYVAVRARSQYVDELPRDKVQFCAERARGQAWSAWGPVREGRANATYERDRLIYGGRFAELSRLLNELHQGRGG